MTISKRSELLAKAVLLLVGVVFALVFAEIGFRILERGAERKKSRDDRPKFYYGAAGSKSMLDVAHLDRKDPGVFRIAVLGDSFSFGPMVQYDDTFAKRLERMLNARQSGGTVEVYNYGVSGFATQHQVQMAALAARQQADLVVLQLTLNDTEVELFSEAAARNSDFAPFKPRGVLGRIVYYWRSLGFVLERLHNRRSRQAHERYYFEIFDKPQNWQGFSTALQQIRDRLAEKKIPFVAVTFPLFGYAFESGRYPFLELHQRVTAELARLSIPGLDLYKSYEGLDTYRLEVLPGRDSHPNEIAHRIAAERLYNWLIRGGYVPDQFKIERRYRARTNLPIDVREADELSRAERSVKD